MSDETPAAGDDGATTAGDDATTADDDGPVETTPAAESEATTERPWYRRYLRESAAHLVVVGLLAAYPGIYHVAVNSPLSAEMVAVLPKVQTMVGVLYFALFAMSFDFISGYTGYLSFGHAAFYGVGAYFVILTANGKLPFLAVGTPFMVSLVLAGLVAAALALLVGSVSFRLTGVYFAMITLGFSQVLYVLFKNWEWVASNPRDGPAVLEHPDGFEVGVPYVDALNLKISQLGGDAVEGLFGVLNFGPVEVSYYMVGLVVLVCYLSMQRILHSPFGRVMVAIRENEDRARAVGYDTYRYKMGAFAISAFYAAVAGGLFAGYQRSVSPEGSLYFLVAGDALLATIIGGFGTLVGGLFGRLFHEGLTEFLSKAGPGGGLLPYLRDHLGEATMNTVLYDGFTVGEFVEVVLNGHAGLYVGLLFVLFVLYVPDGVVGTVRARLGGPVAKRLPDVVLARWRRYR